MSSLVQRVRFICSRQRHREYQTESSHVTGNHAQGVALAGHELSIACTIVMPLNTPSIKYLNVSRLGAKVVLHGADFDEAKKECNRLALLHGLTNIPPFDDPYVIAGQGTVAVEIARQTDVNDLAAIFVCVGGGGLLAGILTYIKAVAPPGVKVIGVETFDADALNQSLAKGERMMLNEVGLFADGTAVRQIGEETWRICAEMVDEIVLVSNDEVCAAIKDVFEGVSRWRLRVPCGIEASPLHTIQILGQYRSHQERWRSQE